MPKTPAKKLFLVDAMGFIFRAFYAPMERLRSPAGIPTKVPYLFASMLRRLQREWQPDFLGVVFDPPGPTFRDEIFAEYKAQRPPMPEDLSVQLPFVRRLCEAMSLPILERVGYEADDVIGALARQAAEKKLDVYVVTSDKDMLQLVGKSIRVIRPGSSTKGDLLVDESEVEKILGVPPAKVADVMALMGDSIDNIPGAKGIGEKGARELILKYGSAEAALDHAAEVKSKRYRQALENGRQQVLLSKKLATIAADAPVSLDLDALGGREPDTEALRALYAELGFTSLLRDLAPTAAESDVTPSTTDYSQLESPAALRKFLASLPADRAVALWLDLKPRDDEFEGFGSAVAAVQISPRPGVARVAWLDDEGDMLSVLAEWAAGATPPKIVHNLKLWHLLVGPANGIAHATMLYSYLLRPTTSNHALSEVVLRHLSVTLSGAAGERADLLHQIAPKLRAEVDARSLGDVYTKIDLPLAPVLALMERHGVRVDPDALAVLSSSMDAEIHTLERHIYDLAGYEFNVNSPQQLAEVLFDKLNLPEPRRRRTKSRSTAAEVLEELALQHELPQHVLEFRELSKLKSTYADALPKLIHPETGRLHTSLSQVGTATGRLSSSNPNLQNIPVRSELGRQIRAAFVAEPGNVLLSADYSQIELRLLAHFSEDSVLLEAFRKGEDIHSRTAQEVFGVGPMAQTAEHRRAAKVINFGIIYGLSAFGLAQQLSIEQKEAVHFIAAYFERYRGVKAWLDRQLAEVREAGFTRTLFGRTRPIPEINSPQPNLRNFAERTAMNTPLQGTAADLIKLAMIEIDRRLAEENCQARMILQVHDELLFEVPAAELDRLRGLVKPAMEHAGADALKVPLVVDFKSGPNWRDMDSSGAGPKS